MQTAMKLSFVSAVMASSANSNSNGSPITKIIELIGELKVKVQADLDAESKAMSEYTNFCDDEATEKGFAIKTASSEIDGYKAVIEDTTGSITDLSGTIDSASIEVSTKNSELKKATEVRDNENSDFKVAEKELVDSIDALSRAVTIIKREMSFVQQGKRSRSNVNEKIQAMSGALQTIISAAWMDTSNKNKLRAFLSTNMDDELSLHNTMASELKQPQAASYNYESKSGGIVSTLEDMKDKAESTLNSLRRDEMKAKHAFEMIKQSLSDAVTTLNKEVSESQSALAAAQEKLGQAEGDLSSTEAAKKADEEYVEQLNTDCASKASEWEERQASAKGELAALSKGMEILSAKFSFAQFSVKSTFNNSKSDLTRDNVVSMLKKMGNKFNSFALMQLAGAASKDPFAKVRGLIESMIAKLETQAQEEATQDAFCKEENSKSKKAKETKQANVDKLQARIDEAKAAVSELKSEIATLSEEISDINAASKKATAMRNSENEAFVKASTDFRESATAVTQALVVLKDFYKSGESFIQTGASTNQPEFGGAKSDASHMILEILEVAQEDFTRLLAEAETAESEAVEAFKKLSQENEVSKSKKETEVTAKTSEVKSIEVALTHHSEDYETTTSELSAVLDYIEKLKPQCESKAMSYEERKARREAEIAGLQEALALLSGDAAFIQSSEKKFLAIKKHTQF